MKKKERKKERKRLKDGRVGRTEKEKVGICRDNQVSQVIKCFFIFFIHDWLGKGFSRSRLPFLSTVRRLTTKPIRSILFFYSTCICGQKRRIHIQGYFSSVLVTNPIGIWNHLPDFSFWSVIHKISLLIQRRL